jgi:hypothetical protein
LASGNKLQDPQQEARDKYLPLISQFISRYGIASERIDEWSALILAAWVRHVRETWPAIARRHLQAALRI